MIGIVGMAFVVFAIVLSFNTSTGGSRSDYNDGSGCIFAVGLVLMIAGMAEALFTLIAWWLS